MKASCCLVVPGDYIFILLPSWPNFVCLSRSTSGYVAFLKYFSVTFALFLCGKILVFRFSSEAGSGFVAGCHAMGVDFVTPAIIPMASVSYTCIFFCVWTLRHHTRILILCHHVKQSQGRCCSRIGSASFLWGFYFPAVFSACFLSVRVRFSLPPSHFKRGCTRRGWFRVSIFSSVESWHKGHAHG